ncbi:uncharacterized protein [Choristoneura fumiferana]
MPKRKAAESKEDRWRRKMKKYEHKLYRQQLAIINSSDEDYEDDSGPTVIADPGVLSVAPPEPLPSPPDDEAADAEPQVVAQRSESAEAEVTQPTATEPADAEAGPSPPAVAEPLPSRLLEPAAAEVIDPELLTALGDFQEETPEWGSDININLAQRWLPILKDGLNKVTRDDISKKYLLPKNCQLMKAPVLNPEIAAVLIDSAKKRDARIVTKQAQMGLALTVLGKTMTGILTKSTETSETLRLLNDAAKLIADSHFAETETRRSLIVPMLDKDFIEPFKDRKRDGYLFGDKLGDFIKSSRGLKKTGQLMQATGSTSSLNSRAPPPFRQQLQRAQVPARRTVGGPRAAQAPSAAYRRRARRARHLPPGRRQ